MKIIKRVLKRCREDALGIGSGLLGLLILAVWSANGFQGFRTTPVFEVPALVGKDISQVRRLLGNPQYTAGLASATIPSSCTWEREGILLRVKYLGTTGRVTEFFVHTTNNHDATGYVDFLKRESGVQELDGRYRVEAAESAMRGIYNGIRITPR